MPQASRLWCLLAPSKLTLGEGEGGKGTTWAILPGQIDDEGCSQRAQHFLIPCRLLVCGEDSASKAGDRKEERH